MGEKPDEITQEIQQTRAELASNLQELETKVRTYTNWRALYHKKPLPMLGIAFGGGLLLSGIVNSLLSDHEQERNGSGHLRKSARHWLR